MSKTKSPFKVYLLFDEEDYEFGDQVRTRIIVTTDAKSLVYQLSDENWEELCKEREKMKKLFKGEK